MNEDRLHELTRGLGARAVERLDVERTAQAVVARLREAPVAGVRGGVWQWLSPGWLRVAAVAVVLLGGAFAMRSLLFEPPRTGPAHYVLEDLGGLSSGELSQLLTSLDEALDLTAPTVPEPGLDQLTEEQLRAMLRSLEG